jgi:NADPH-dependent 2,4-dienoyl-CoA reductase/sulfur reductase-like enzyme
MEKTDVVVIGAGPAGLAAAIKAAEENVKVILLERSTELGGILNQCIHQGFGNFVFKKMLTGPEYAQHYIDKIKKLDIKIKTDTMVLQIKHNKTVIATNMKDGLFEIKTKAIILAMGCRERTRFQILLPGTRPAGIYTAGTTQRLINVEGIMPGKKVVVLGSGDVGLIMARRFILEGAKVEGVYEILPNPGGLTRNIVQCLEDYDIPLYLSHTVTNIHGKERVEGVTVAEIDKLTMKPIKETERHIPCDCLILAVGLIPENELSKQISDLKIDSKTSGPFVDEHMETSNPGVFACGNVVHVHDVVDDVTITAETAGIYASKYVKDEFDREKEIPVIPGENVSYIVPQIIRGKLTDPITFYFRVKHEMKNVICTVYSNGNIIFEKKERIVKPPEMIKLTIQKDKIRDRLLKELQVDVKEIK